jgi:hypothetical protein
VLNKAIVPHRDRSSSTTMVKSTLIATSRQGLFTAGHQHAYERALGGELAGRMQAVAMSNEWLPLELAELHYRAADAIGLSVDEMHLVGNVVGARIEGALMGSLARLARTGGITPWTPLSRLDQLWFRMYRGGSIAVFETGPKDARIEIVDNDLANIRYWRVALTGLMHGIGKVFAKTMITNLVQRDRAAGTATYTLRWV